MRKLNRPPRITSAPLRPPIALQLPAPGQTKELSTKRQVSSIPKGGTDGTWTYPSEQMFFNALSRKGKADGVTEDDMSVVIAIHNNMNETTWKRLLEWENRHLECVPPPAVARRTPHTTALHPPILTAASTTKAAPACAASLANRTTCP